jgi:hypothetical protein
MIKSPIIPSNVLFYGKSETLDYKAICIFAAIGFFLDEDTYYRELKCLRASTIMNADYSQYKYFEWNYNPRDISFKHATEEFAELFETIINEQVGDKKVILPLSGGLDSRTQATALKQLGKEVNCYSYRFDGGHNESSYGKSIAEVCEFPIQNWIIPRGYLWDCIDQLAMINGCYSEFTHPRQMAFIHQYAGMGDIFSLGHWGDVLFDDMGVPEHLQLEQQVDVVLRKIIKKGGLELADTLWKIWGLPGAFESYLRNRIKELLSKIDIPHSANARIRAFKSLYWAPRWTSVNLSVFDSVRPITLPYYDDRMCRLICTLPEKYLSGRRIQIEYIKMRAPKLARISWQQHRPYNLYNYKLDRLPWNIPPRLFYKTFTILNKNSKEFVQRNWELQFLCEQNDKQLKKHLFGNSLLQELVPENLVSHFYRSFTEKDNELYAHPLSILLTLSMKSTLIKKTS